MKIPPRYSSTIENPVKGSSRSLTTGTSGSNTLAQIGASAMTEVLNYGAKKNALTAKLRRLEINTNITNIDTATVGHSTKFLSTLPNRDDYLNPDVWVTDFDKQALKWETQFKASVDEQTWKEGKAVFWKNIWTYRDKVATKANDQKVANGTMAFEQSFVTYNSKLENSKSIAEMKSHYQYQKDYILPKYDKLLMNSKGYAEARLKIKINADTKVAMFQANEHGTATLITPKGDLELDWEKIARNLKNATFHIRDADNKKLTVDDDFRQSLIADAVKKASTQKKYLEDMRENKNKADKKQLTNDLIEIKQGTEDGKLLANTYLEKVQNSDLNTTEKRALVSSFETHFKTGVKGWETVQGQKANTILNILIGNRVIDTEGERSMLDEVYWDGLVSDDDYRTLNKRIDDNIKDRNKYKVPLYKNVISMLGTEMGMKDVSKLMEIDSTNPVDIQAFLQNKFPKSVFDTLNYFTRLLAEGEKQGFTYDEMLSDTTSKNYIVDKVLTFAKAAKDGKIDMTEQVDVSFLKDLDGSLNDAIHWDKPYTIGYDLWFDGLTPLGDDREIPKRLEGETVNAYLTRTMSELKKKNIKLPSVITGYNFDEDLDLNTELIVPNMD